MRSYWSLGRTLNLSKVVKITSPLESDWDPASMPMRLNMISVLNILSQQASKESAHLPQELNLIPFMICTAVHVDVHAGKPLIP